MSVLKYPAIPVLFVDDEEDVLQSYKMTLRMNRINNFEMCIDSTMVFDMLAEKQFSTAVLDLSMPNVTGQDILRHIREHHPHIPVIIVTGTNEVNTAVNCMKDGAYDYMVKPVEESRLISSIRNAQELVEVQRENSALKDQVLNAKLKKPEVLQAKRSCS